MNQRVRFNPELVKKYDVAGPRYTSYPTAVQFHEGFDADVYRRYVAQSNDELIPSPLSLYVHLPFCRSLCYYCGCTKKVTRHEAQAEAYLDLLFREIEMRGSMFDRDREVTQLHFGGGTPTFFNDAQLTALMGRLEQSFAFSASSDREFSIEVDPRTVDAERLARLAELGLNRISLGVQDIDPKVQEAVNRIQDPAATLDMVSASRRLGFHSVSIDLIYGLPLQTTRSFRDTLDAVIEARPDRLAVYNYAHMPHVFRSQRMINEADIPSPQTKLELMELTIEMLTGKGYVYIGMDHFALPDDELTVAQREGHLQRNFQGYSTRAECDLIGLGVSAIGKISDCYAQNLKEIPHWSAALSNGALPVWRGIGLTVEDRLRRAVIESIMCHGKVEFAVFEHAFDLDFSEHFAPELHQLESQAEDGLLELDEQGFEVSSEGRLLLRAVAMVFDEYLQSATQQPRFSRVI
jgi:oxygen-independent coproporphyrinogen-3 oxidase